LAEIDLQCVGLDHFQPAILGVRLRESLRQIAIDFDGDDAIRAGQQVRSESAPAGTDLDDERLPIGTCGARDAFENRAANQEMLAEFLARHG
jgi:hypothetical protein